MQEETNEDEEDEEEDSPPTKRVRSETMVLDDDEVEIASGLRPIRGTSQAAGSQDGGDSGVGGESDAVEDDGDDGHIAGFEDNGVCLSFIFSHDINTFISAILDYRLSV
jgi:hypothetical protein